MTMRLTRKIVAIVVVLGVGGRCKGPCDSPIYCQGELLHAVQMARLFADDKTFVDKPTLKPEAQVLAAFARIGGANASRPALERFVAENFGQEGSELRAVDVGAELAARPGFLERVANPVVRAFGREVHGYWGQLIREQDTTRLCAGCVSSMLRLARRFVVPGGRFRETYYWDTYFALEGMLRSGLVDLSKSTIGDLLDLVDAYGFVPNGARVYYLDRSQPPVLTLMVKLYYEFTHDVEFVRGALPRLQREYAYWTDKHCVDVRVGSRVLRLSRYFVDTDVPRPEAYSDDYELAHNVTGDPQIQARLYADLATGAESGWDFSTRWVRDIHRAPVLETIRTRQVVPVDLNAILYQVEMALGELSDMVHGSSGAYRQAAGERRQAMDAAMLDPTSGLYFDYLLEDARRSTEFAAAAVWPYWAFADGEAKLAARAFAYLGRVLDGNPGGVPATLTQSGQQWDWPMAWPPLQYVAMQGALRYGDPVGVRLAQSYVDSVLCAWYATGGSLPGVLEKLGNATDSGHMFEKFDSAQVGSAGGGGEYTVQAGFGWTNGVLIWTLDKFGPQLTAPKCLNLNFIN
ncbi:hypothetical protein IWW52_000493 [Coemansia sp. RSA 2704]|nr:hypothetical protein IWW52_000493 [Coemansia sp. RSA 2704]